MLAAAVVMPGCANIPTPAARVRNADALASADAWKPLDIPAGEFVLRAYVPRHALRRGSLAIYIGGDGFAWFNRQTPSNDPTPVDPLALKLALAQPRGQAVYLARPCQFVGPASRGCNVRAWTNRRFGPDAVSATNRAVQVLKQRFSASRLTLVGYSGGAAVAALVAARRKDVVRLVAVAGNLDTRAWAAFHRVSRLRGSLDPVDAIDRLGHVRIWCLAGGDDRDVPPALVHAFAGRFPASTRPTVLILPGVNHHEGWVRRWPELWNRMVPTIRPIHPERTGIIERPESSR